MKIEKFVVILVAQNGAKTHLKLSVNRDDKTAEIRLAESPKREGGKIYLLSDKITEQELYANKYEYKMPVIANESVDILLQVDEKLYAGGTGKTPQVRALKSRVECYELALKNNDKMEKCKGDEIVADIDAEGVVASRTKTTNNGKEEGRTNALIEGVESLEKEDKTDDVICCGDNKRFSNDQIEISAEDHPLNFANNGENSAVDIDEENHDTRQEFEVKKEGESKIFAFDSVRFDGNNFYLSVKPQLDEIFVCYPEEEVLCSIVPNSRWVRINTPDGFYVVGLILDGDAVSYICYGVPSTNRNVPPAEIVDFAVWLSVSGNEERGYWLIYQDALTGKCLK